MTCWRVLSRQPCTSRQEMLQSVLVKGSRVGCTVLSSGVPLENTKTSQCSNCGRFVLSCKKGKRNHHYDAAAANLTQECTLAVAAPDFEPEANHIGPAMQEVQYEQKEKDAVLNILQAHQTLSPETWEPVGQSAQVLVDWFSAITGKAAQEGSGPATGAWSELKKFPWCTLSDNRYTKRIYTSQQAPGERPRREQAATSRQEENAVRKVEERSAAPVRHVVRPEAAGAPEQGKNLTSCTTPGPGKLTLANSGSDAETRTAPFSSTATRCYCFRLQPRSDAHCDLRRTFIP